MAARITPNPAPAFKPLWKPSRYKVAKGGRGSGKSHNFAEALVTNAAANQGFRAVCVREVQKSLRESAKRLIEDKIMQLGVADLFNIQNDRIITPGDGVIIFQGMQDHTAESIKSLEGFNVAWCEESQTMTSRSLEMLRPTIRTPGSELWFSYNPRLRMDAVDQFFVAKEPPEDCVIVHANYDANPHFPKELEAERLFDKKARPDRYAHIWLGDYEPQAVGAIWSMSDIEDARVDEAPKDLDRIVVAIDPAVSSEEYSDEHGILVAGKDGNAAYVLDDGTTKGSPRKWAQRAVALYDYYQADAIVIEKNQGGDMCRHTLETVRQGLPIVEVHATRGKHVRAEPVSALYALGRVHHVGSFPTLEAQMCQVTAAGYEGEGSPDRVDALVWALTDLFPSIIRKSDPYALRKQVVADMDYDPANYEESVTMWGKQQVAVME